MDELPSGLTAAALSQGSPQCPPAPRQHLRPRSSSSARRRGRRGSPIVSRRSSHDQMAKAAAHHRAQRPAPKTSTARKDDIAGQMTRHELRIGILARATKQDVALGDDPEPVGIGIDHDSSPTPRSAISLAVARNVWLDQPSGPSGSYRLAPAYGWLLSILGLLELAQPTA